MKSITVPRIMYGIEWCNVLTKMKSITSAKITDASKIPMILVYDNMWLTIDGNSIIALGPSPTNISAIPPIIKPM